MTSNDTPKDDSSSISHNIRKFTQPTFPYNGRARNLIDRLLIIGYEPKLISKLTPTIIQKHTDNPAYFQSGYKLDSPPSILNSISYNYSKDILDDEIILNLIFPNPPSVFYLKNTPLKNLNLGTSGIVFSLSPQDNNNSKKSYNGFAYLFYEIDRFSQSNNILAFPKVFCFLSEYPYFAAFYNISEKLYKLFQNDSLSFPLEAVLYNLVSFTPSPLNFSMDLAIWKVVYGSNSEDGEEAHMKSQRSTKKKGTPSPGGGNMGTRMSMYDDNYVYFPQVSGYPLINFNLGLLFNIFPVHLIVEVFLISFLEVDILFYSTNLELLNLVMFVISSFNYPCNESIYFWHVLSVSIESFMKGTSTFAGKTCSTIIGINNAYDPNVKTIMRIREHFVFDIDRKEFSYVSSGDMPESENNRMIFEGIDRIINGNSGGNGGEISEAIRNLYVSLSSLAKKVMQYNQNNSNGNANAVSNSELFKYDDNIAKHNRNIQNLFYSFMINIFMLNYKQYKLHKVDSNNTNNTNSNNDNSNNNNSSDMLSCMYSSTNKNIKSNTYTNNTISFYTELQTDFETNNDFEQKFINKFKESSKFGTYFINLMLFYDTIDLFKIPLIFTEEFINRNIAYITDKNQLYTNKYNYMDIIDNIYYAKNNDDVEKIGTSKKDFPKSLYKVITFNEFYNFVETNLKNDFFRQQRTDNDYFDWWILGTNIKTKYKKCEVNTKYLLQYAHMINNLEVSELKRIFPMKSYLNESISIKETKHKTISDIIERSLIKLKCFTKIDYIIYTIFAVFTITRHIPKNEDALFEISLLMKLSSLSKYSLRKYFMNILHVYQSLYINAHKDKNNERQMQMYSKCYNVIRNHICDNNIFPNEELMHLIANEVIPYAEPKSSQNEFIVSIDVQSVSNDKHSYRANPSFEYVNVSEFANNKERNEHERKMWIYSDNLDICTDIAIDVDGEGITRHSRSKDSKDSLTKGTALEMVCSIIGEDEFPKRKMKLYSPLKMYNESNKLVSKYINEVEFTDKERTKLKNVIWNLVYYIYLIRMVVPDIRSKEKRENEYEGFPLEIQNALLSYYVSMLNEVMNKNKGMDDEEDDNMMVLSFKDFDNEE